MKYSLVKFYGLLYFSLQSSIFWPDVMESISFTLLLLLSLVTTFLVSKFTIRKLIPLSTHGRFIEIDGLRGYLALMVAAHHFYIIYGWVLTDKWQPPEFIVFNNLGVFAVSIFFMITGFLFIGKVDRARANKNLDFFSIMKSRFFRIYPLYLLAVIITVFLSLHTTGYKIIESKIVIKDVFKWLVFLGDSVNGYQDSKRITAGVTWTLRYEWLFYLSLLVIYIISKVKYGLAFMGFVVATFALLQVDFLFFNSLYLIFFVLGGLAYFINKKYSARVNRSVFKGWLASFALSASMILCLFLPEKEHLILFSVFSFVFFVIIVMGGDLFGLLCMNTSRALGEISYSIYLMHGIVFFVFFKMIWPELINYNFYSYISLLPICLLCVVFFSTFTFLKIELPSIKAGKVKLQFNRMLSLQSKNEDNNGQMK